MQKRFEASSRIYLKMVKANQLRLEMIWQAQNISTGLATPAKNQNINLISGTQQLKVMEKS